MRRVHHNRHDARRADETFCTLTVFVFCFKLNLFSQKIPDYVKKKKIKKDHIKYSLTLTSRSSRSLTSVYSFISFHNSNPQEKSQSIFLSLLDFTGNANVRRIFDDIRVWSGWIARRELERRRGMPLTRYQIRNEYSLADPELYKAADRDDPEALLEGVAMAGLVGVLRQLGDLAEWVSASDLQIRLRLSSNSDF